VGSVSVAVSVIGRFITAASAVLEVDSLAAAIALVV